jgi:hypothetical protein
VIGSDKESLLVRLRYILSNGCKEGLVASPLHWPGVSSTAALLDGSMALHGIWFNRTREYRSRKVGLRCVFSEEEEVHLSKLPAFSESSLEHYRDIVQDVVRGIEMDTLKMHRANGTKPAGAKWVMDQKPHRTPRVLKKSPARKFLAACRHMIHELRRAYCVFLAQYRDASSRLKAGDRFVEFPPGSFPPRMPFVRAGPQQAV